MSRITCPETVFCGRAHTRPSTYKLNLLVEYELSALRAEGYLLKFKWDKFSALIKNKSIYSFTACRKATRALASAVKQNSDIDFYEY